MKSKLQKMNTHCACVCIDAGYNRGSKLLYPPIWVCGCIVREEDPRIGYYALAPDHDCSVKGEGALVRMWLRSMVYIMVS